MNKNNKLIQTMNELIKEADFLEVEVLLTTSERGTEKRLFQSDNFEDLMVEYVGYINSNVVEDYYFKRIFISSEDDCITLLDHDLINQFIYQ